MKVLNYLYKHFPKNTSIILLLCIGVAFSRALILRAVNSGVQHLLKGDDISNLDFISALLGIGLLILIQPIYYHKSVHLVERFIVDFRIRIAQKVNQISLHTIEKIGQYRFFEAVIYQLTFLSQSTYMLVMLLQSIFEWLLIVLYVGLFISPTTAISVFFVVISLLFLLGITKLKRQKLHKKIDQNHQKYIQSLDDLLMGFKELKVNYKKQKDLQDSQNRYLKNLHQHIPDFLEMTESMQHVTKIANYTLLGLLVFIIPIIFQFPIQQAVQTGISILFIVLPLFRIVIHWGRLPLFDAVMTEMTTLEQLLDQNIKNKHTKLEKKIDALPFNDQLVLKDITFTYGQKSYTLGPIDLRLQKGETLFIIGGNGSGKSTFLKVLTGLYTYSTGSVEIDDQKVADNQKLAYRELFAAIFTDFHLSDKILGVKKVNRKKAHQLLALFGLKGKTLVKDNTFTNIHLSTGQRKRLAMVAAFLENKDIYIFDEVAADQDPDHRKLFYEFILPDIKKAGKTCIVVSHDDHYFHTADRILEMRNGQLHPYASPNHK